jgi:CopG family transcriptional regulator / antitoxin EndoAI
MHRPINITLPDETIQLLDRVAGKGDRIRLIDRAVRDYIDWRGRANLKRLLEEQATRRARTDRQLAAAWFHVEEEAWPNPDV